MWWVQQFESLRKNVAILYFLKAHVSEQHSRPQLSNLRVREPRHSCLIPEAPLLKLRVHLRVKLCILYKAKEKCFSLGFICSLLGLFSLVWFDMFSSLNVTFLPGFSLYSTTTLLNYVNNPQYF